MPTIDKSSTILQCVISYGPRVRLAHLQQLTNIPKPTLHRLLHTMIEHGLIRQDDTGIYSVGSELFRLAHDVYNQFHIPVEARQIMIDLQHEAKETIHLSLFRGGQLVYAEKLEAPHPFQMVSRVGKLQPLHSSAIGKAVLALLPEPEAAQLLARSLKRMTEFTIVDPRTLLTSLAAVRIQGFAVDDEEDEAGLRAIGCAICDAQGRPTGGLSIVAPSFQMSLTQAYAYAPLLVEAGRRIAEVIAQCEPDGPSADASVRVNDTG
jgi:IclR family transcriptional regulator, acetate operon repressor